jgi:PBP1b-binding outer membrane lipoprotein LpoB
MLKRLLIVVFFAILLVGCGQVNKTPTSQATSTPIANTSTPTAIPTDTTTPTFTPTATE